MVTGHPSFRLVKWADFGTEEEWAARVSFGLIELLNGLKLEEQEQNRTADAFRQMIDELGSAFMALRKVQALEETENISQMELHKEYSDIYHHLWTAYQDRLQTLAKTIGYDIGFLFQSPANFKKGAAAFRAAHPRVRPVLIDIFREDRRIWQNKLAEFRNNVIQHKDEGMQPGAYFTPVAAKRVFDNVWQAIEEIVLLLVEPKIPFPYQIYEIPVEDRNPLCPTRFEVSVRQDIIEAVNKTHG